MIADPWFYALALPAILVAGISKGGFGGGVGFLAVPMLALVISPIQAAAIMLPLLCVMDIVGVWGYRRHWHRANMAALLPGALAGIAIGTASFRYLDDDIIRLMVGALALGFTLHHWLGGGERGQAARPPTRAGAPIGGLWGAVAGFTSFIAHAGGPPFSVYVLPQRLDKTEFVGTSVIFFFAVNYAKLLPYAWLGLLDGGNLVTSAALMPLAPIGMLLGMWLHRRISPDWFYRLCYLMVFAAGIKLVYDGGTALLG